MKKMTMRQAINEALHTAMNSDDSIITFGEDIAVYEKAVEDWYKNGGQTITDEVNAYYAAQK